MSLTLNTYWVTYFPFLGSDATSTAFWTGKDEADCKESFEKAHPSWAVKSVEEKS